ncbi:DUF429 domain-containing protein [Gemmatimonadota bacterium]
MIAIDGPILRDDEIHYNPRACEKAFVLGAFQKRCKPGESHFGEGAGLRRAGCDTAKQFSGYAPLTELSVPFPRIQKGNNIVEAFPNAFMGVMLNEGLYLLAKDLVRGEKSDWLYEMCVQIDQFHNLLDHLDLEDARFQNSINSTTDHDERAALVCCLTALCVTSGGYVAVGEPKNGYFFLPPWEMWESWAKSNLINNMTSGRLPAPISIWISGTEFVSPDNLPD